ncbi:unnamed protein product [Pararhodospirillum photometricum DSM 122]|uniref:Uncharacterized protein n=1 Tax=Pararhodospirillum photometricum DSM 122 TaxID=1150469 RepID=H6SML8_PARPM|nr:unnamed protein product [Pararhodospirillum photometricum DSM 122]
MRFDILPRAPDRFLSDYKTSTSIALDDIARSAWEYRWPLQAAFYMDAFAATVGEPARGFAFLVQEKASPFAVRVTPHGRKRH